MQKSNTVPFENSGIVATLLSASVTTGWLDWIHGELWLLPEGLLRIPSNLIVTLEHGMLPTVNKGQSRLRYFDEQTLNRLINAPENVWVPRWSIQKAYLHHGIATDRLRLIVEHQRSVKFLWFPWDDALPLLQAALTAWLGSGLVID